MKCSNCGNEITEGQRFCTYCGKPVMQPQEADPMEEQPVQEQPVQEQAAQEQPVPEQALQPQPEEQELQPEECETQAQPQAQPEEQTMQAQADEQAVDTVAEEIKPSEYVERSSTVETVAAAAEPVKDQSTEAAGATGAVCTGVAASTTEAGSQTAYSTAKSADAIIASIPKDYKPLPVWQFLCFEVLFSVPIIGVIASLIFSLEASKNVNLINFARARFLWTVVETLITLFVFVMALVRFL